MSEASAEASAAAPLRRQSAELWQQWSEVAAPSGTLLAPQSSFDWDAARRVPEPIVLDLSDDNSTPRPGGATPVAIDGNLTDDEDNMPLSTQRSAASVASSWIGSAPVENEAPAAPVADVDDDDNRPLVEPATVPAVPAAANDRWIGQAFS